jgi:hypothetical protein
MRRLLFSCPLLGAVVVMMMGCERPSPPTTPSPSASTSPSTATTPSTMSDPLFPHPPPIQGSDPALKEKRRFEIPKKLVADGKTYRLDTTAMEVVELDVTQKLVTGIFFEAGGGHGGTSGTRLDHGPTLTPGADGRVEVKIRVIETDIPVQHGWMPESGTKYRVLWSTTLRAP